MVEFADFNQEPREPPMTETSMPLIELLQKQGDDDFLRAVAEAVLQLLMEHDVEGLVGAGRYERGDGRLTWRNGYRDRELKTRLGNLAGFELLPGQRHDTLGVAPLIEGVEFGGLIADKAFDVNWIVEALRRRGAEIVISQHPNRVAPRTIDAETYKWRHLLENFFGKLKDFKRIALRACKTDSSFSAMIHASAAWINSR